MIVWSWNNYAISRRLVKSFDTHRELQRTLDEQEESEKKIEEHRERERLREKISSWLKKNGKMNLSKLNYIWDIPSYI